MILTIVSFRDVVKLRNAVQKIDPEALFMVSTISEVRGRGFSSDRITLPKTEEVGEEDMREVAPEETVAPLEEGAEAALAQHGMPPEEPKKNAETDEKIIE